MQPIQPQQLTELNNGPILSRKALLVAAAGTLFAVDAGLFVVDVGLMVHNATQEGPRRPSFLNELLKEQQVHFEQTMKFLYIADPETYQILDESFIKARDGLYNPGKRKHLQRTQIEISYKMSALQGSDLPTVLAAVNTIINKAQGGPPDETNNINVYVAATFLPTESDLLRRYYPYRVLPDEWALDGEIYIQLAQKVQKLIVSSQPITERNITQLEDQINQYQAMYYLTLFTSPESQAYLNAGIDAHAFRTFNVSDERDAQAFMQEVILIETYADQIIKAIQTKGIQINSYEQLLQLAQEVKQNTTLDLTTRTNIVYQTARDLSNNTLFAAASGSIPYDHMRQIAEAQIFITRGGK